MTTKRNKPALNMTLDADVLVWIESMGRQAGLKKGQMAARLLYDCYKAEMAKTNGGHTYKPPSRLPEVVAGR